MDWVVWTFNWFMKLQWGAKTCFTTIAYYFLTTLNTSRFDNFRSKSINGKGISSALNRGNITICGPASEEIALCTLHNMFISVWKVETIFTFLQSLWRKAKCICAARFHIYQMWWWRILCKTCTKIDRSFTIWTRTCDPPFPICTNRPIFFLFWSKLHFFVGANMGPFSRIILHIRFMWSLYLYLGINPPI